MVPSADRLGAMNQWPDIVLNRRFGATLP
jgi:hypothetical protein